jgi:hypothetical protein
MENALIQEIAKLEIRLWILSDLIGPNEPEVKEFERKIRELELELLDYMVGEKGA